MFDLVCKCSYQSFILLLIKEEQKNIAQLFLHYNFLKLSWIKMKNFLLIILNNLSNIYGPFLKKNFFYSIRLQNCISYSEYWIEQYSHCIGIADIILTELKIVLPIHNSELSSIHDAHTENANIIFRLKSTEICSKQFL